WAGVIGEAFFAVPCADMGPGLARILLKSPWWAALFVRLALWLVYVSPVWMRGRPRSFAALAEEEREGLLEDLLLHRVYVVREAAAILKLFLCMVALGNQQALSRIGAYDLSGQEARP